MAFHGELGEELGDYLLPCSSFFFFLPPFYLSNLLLFTWEDGWNQQGIDARKSLVGGFLKITVYLSCMAGAQAKPWAVWALRGGKGRRAFYLAGLRGGNGRAMGEFWRRRTGFPPEIVPQNMVV
jgi:hypothetical protein